MAGKPIATVGSMHVCPMCTGTVPHVGGPVIGPGASNVMINGKSAALLGDMCTCVGPPAVIVIGNAAVKINSKPVVCQGDMTYCVSDRRGNPFCHNTYPHTELFPQKDWNKEHGPQATPVLIL